MPIDTITHLSLLVQFTLQDEIVYFICFFLANQSGQHNEKINMNGW